MNIICRLFGHSFRYVRRYYRCRWCGKRRCEIKTPPKRIETMEVIYPAPYFVEKNDNS